MLAYEIIDINYNELEDLKIKEKNYQPFILAINKENIKFEFLMKINNSDKALILGSGAYNPEKMQLPLFQRHSWIDDFDYNIIYYNDPTLYMGDIRLGWGYGTKDRYFLEEICEIIIKILNILSIKRENAYFYGSSGGGFMSIMLATMCKGSVAIVNNPQTNFFKYKKETVMKLFNIIYGDYKEEYIYKNLWRISSLENMYRCGNYPKIYYLQNLASKYDIDNHLLPFIKKNYEKEYKNNVEIYLYYNLQQGHDPVNKRDTIRFINSSIDKNEEK